MNHKSYLNLIMLKLCGELPPDKLKKLETHICKCKNCKNESQSLSRTIKLAKENDVEISELLIKKSHRELCEKIFNKKPKNNLFENLFENLKKQFSANYLQLGFTFSVFVIGIILGSGFFGEKYQVAIPKSLSTNSIENIDYGKSFISEVKHVQIDEKTNEIELFFETATPSKIKANLNDPKMQELVEHSILREDNPGVRLQLLDMISKHISNGNKISSTLSKSLAKVAMFDENAGARIVALENLLHLPFDDEVRSAVVHILANDNNVGLRTNAINFLTTKSLEGESIDKETKNILKGFAKNDENKYIKMQAMNLLEATK